VVEQPTYDRTLLMLRRLGVELVPVVLEADGLDIGAFEAALAEGPIKLAHVIPNFHNPAGCTLSAEKRVRLVELAAEHDASLLVVGCHGPRSSLLGSVSADVSRRAPCPVVVVPPGADATVKARANGGEPESSDDFAGGIVRFGLGGGATDFAGGIVRFSLGARDGET
jgi:hypothetical protein